MALRRRYAVAVSWVDPTARSHGEPMNYRQRPMVRTTLPVVAACAVLALSLTACSSGSTSPGSSVVGTTTASGAATGVSTAATSTSAPSPSITTGDEGGASGPPTFRVVDVCALVPFATVRQVTGKGMTKGVTIHVGEQDTDTYGCAYNTDLDDDPLEVKVFASGADDLWTLITTDPKRTITPVAGLGDKAVYDNDSTLYARKGDYVVQVNGLTDTAQAAQLAAPVLGAL